MLSVAVKSVYLHHELMFDVSRHKSICILCIVLLIYLAELAEVQVFLL